jgi:lysophospholipase L1-like esterase
MTWNSRCFAYALLAASSAAALAQMPASSSDSTGSFALKDGDRVTFYGDSITEQREYTEDIENFVLTRYPKWKVAFHNAGVGGDMVSGGHAGPVDLRLERDVYPWKPNVITIMLGMNDGYYRADEPGIYSTYTAGYRHIVSELQKNLPQAEITLIQPSAYDDVTRAPLFAGGYNGVLLKYSNFLQQLSQERHVGLTDFNTPVTAFLKQANEQAPDLAQQIIPDRVHPQQGGHWIMAESLLKTWHAPSLVSSVSINAGSKTPAAEAKGAKVTDLRKSKAGALSWTELDEALPLPLTPGVLDPAVGMAVKYTDLVAALDQETLTVRGLATGSYTLSIDGRPVGTYNSDDLTSGVNLATADTPMLEQSLLLAADTAHVNNLEEARFQIIYHSAEGLTDKTAVALANAMPAAVARQQADAQPHTHQFELAPASTHP